MDPEIAVLGRSSSQQVCTLHAPPPMCAYSGTSPKPGAAWASAAKILQYSRLMFWILHPCAVKRTNAGQQGSSWAPRHVQL